jgi:glycosyltransferase involved in cell wall biosynthesis
MRVLHVQKVNGVGGSERHLLELVPRLRARGVDATFCVLTEPGAEEFVLLLGAAGVPTHRIPAGPDLNPLLVPRLAAVLRRERPDLVHTHLIHADTHGQVAAALTRVPSVRSVHNTMPGLARQPYRTAGVVAGRLARRTIAISDYARDYTVSNGLAPADRVRVVKYGIDADRWRIDDGDRDAARAGLGLAPGAVAVVAASRLVAHKGHDVLLRAFAAARRSEPALRLLVAGAGDLRPALEAQARPLGDAVRFLGHLDEAGVRRLMLAGDIVVFPSLASFGEGFGLAALEASAAGRPLVASRVASLPEIVVDGTTGVLVGSGDADGLAGALVELARDPAARARMGAAGRARAERAFTLPRMIDETLAVYEEARAR